MKNVYLLILLLITFTGFAQDNAVKLVLSGISYGDYTLGYERAINSKSSINVNVGFFNPNSGLFQINKKYYNEGSIAKDGVWIGDINTGFNASAEYRFYMGKNNALTGFYIAPYLKYWKLDFMLKDEIRGDYFDINSTIKGLGVGAQFGYQWVIAKMVTIDWYFLGIGGQKFTGVGDYVIKPQKTGFDYASIVPDITDVYKNVNYVYKNIKTEVRNNDLELKIPVWIPDIRCGLSVGIAF